jgi:UTP--glucose-1-phosphate uridylyltransferase
MKALALALAVWFVDRFEPPYVVVVSDRGEAADVERARLPADVEVGDRLLTPEGPVLDSESTQRALLPRRVARLASGWSVRQAARVWKPRDHYARKAKKDGFAARSVYKLDEIDQRAKLLRKGQRVLDLGCSPGSWMQYAAKAVGPKGRVLGLDLKPVNVSLPRHAEALEADVFAAEPTALQARAGGPFDVVMSDMAPATTGQKGVDHLRSVELCRRASDVARRTLAPGGAFVCKVFDGGDLPAFVEELRADFDAVRRIRPKSVRQVSKELFLVAQGYRPAGGDQMTDDLGLRDQLDADERALLERAGPGIETLECLAARGLAGAETKNHVTGVLVGPGVGDICVLPTDSAELAVHRQRGEAALRAGAAGIVVLNGGMATRFGGVVKGVVEVEGGRSFLGLKLLDALRAAESVGGPPPVVILMNSRATAEATQAHLEANDWFGYPAERVWSFEQHQLVRLAPDGRVFRDAEGRASFYGPGHGDLLPCLRKSGLLDRFAAAGGETLLMSNVDNTLATLDPALLGWHLAAGAEMTVEVVPKYEGDAGGAPVYVDGHLQIVEGFRFPPDFDQSVSPVFNTNTMWFSMAALRSDAELTWFTVSKRVERQPVVQFERLVGQLTASVPSAFLEVPREGCGSRFVPVKTPEDLERERAAICSAWAARDARA